MKMESAFRHIIAIVNGYCCRLIAPIKWIRLSKSQEINLELGSRTRRLNGFITIDLIEADICHNLLKGIPLASNSVSGIYSSHLFEHFAYKDLVSILKHCYRVLRPSGFFSICVPNAGAYIEAYHEKRYFLERNELYKPAVIDTNSFIDQINYVAYLNGQHKHMFDNEHLQNILYSVGFSEVLLRQFDPALDLLERKHESIYAVAYK